ncbi:hypothetical protein CEXT_468231 [Caerostris extrusa]|uniref:Uncharacterized protein n=1 Tax=Caerostris extrusa TaxID=172846 RepID=A0AAV4R1F0_CAEEX|nr:hypothetical protein CEXT_468231 [Caerostris extrusa]
MKDDNIDKNVLYLFWKLDSIPVNVLQYGTGRYWILGSTGQTGIRFWAVRDRQVLDFGQYGTGRYWILGSTGQAGIRFWAVRQVLILGSPDRLFWAVQPMNVKHLPVQAGVVYLWQYGTGSVLLGSTGQAGIRFWAVRVFDFSPLIQPVNVKHLPLGLV